MGPDGSLYVTEGLGERLVKLDAKGVQQWTIGTAGVYGGDNAHFGDVWNGPSGVALDTGGNVYVADTANHRVQIFDSGGAWIGRLGKTRDAGSDATRFDGPQRVAINTAGNIYVTDTNNGRIQKCVRSGVGGTCTTFASGFNGPFGVAVDGQGNVFVSEMWGPRGPSVQKCSLTGACSLFAGVMNQGSDEFGYLAGPLDLAVDAQGRVYVAEQGNGRVQVLDSAGAYLATIGGLWGWSTGDLRDPSSVAVDMQGNVYIADSTNHRIQKFAPGVPGWRQVNINGFGERKNWGVFTLEVFNGQLYAGTGSWADGAGGTVWRTGDGTTWTRVSEIGFGSPNINRAIFDMTVFKDRLYASTGRSGGQLWRSADGLTWGQVEGNGFGTDATGIAASTVWGDNIYACTYNDASGTGIWRSSTGNPGTWARVASGGNGNPSNFNCSSFQLFDGYLYASIENNNSGVEIWRSTDGATWTAGATGGFGDAANRWAGGMTVFDDALYVGRPVCGHEQR